MKVLFFDTESTDLAASFGHILCASFAELGGDPWTFDIHQLKGRTKIDDGRLVKAIRDELEKADLIVGWNSILHDIPLLNARLARVGARELRIGEKYGTWHLDLMYYAGGQSMKIGSRRLANVANYFKLDHEKTPLDGEIWQLAGAGDRGALECVIEHCEADVLVLRDVWPKLVPMVKKFQFTLSQVWPWIQDIEKK